jgi:HEPN domain-containing protein
MSDEYSHWFAYADENLAVARLALDGGYYNACLQNVQQAACPMK